MRIFVYGTLKRGYGLHAAYLAKCPYLGRAIAPGFALYGTSIPYMLQKEDGAVAGEVYEVNNPALVRTLDRIEGAYDRQCWAIRFENGREELAHMYVARHVLTEEPTAKWRTVLGVYDYNEPRHYHEP
jgi:gamma-glutamylcyclotransferase (GGCT)/AIG2-like uncharacterized protein YtfP